MLNSKCLLLVVGILLLGNASAHAEGEFLRDAIGNIKYMDQLDAMKACPKGTHLPTIRELANEFQANGAKGILELNQVTPGEVPPGYYKISAINPDGQKDEFYFSILGYTNESYGPPSWSSSVESGRDQYAFIRKNYVVYDPHGANIGFYVESVGYNYGVGVRCFRDR